MKPFYRILIKPEVELKIKFDQNLLEKIQRNKPWFLILRKYEINEDFIKFFDETGAKASLNSRGIIKYQELIMLKEVDITRTIALILGVLKLAKIIYFDKKIPFKLYLEITNIKGRNILKSDELGIKETKVKNDVFVEKHYNFELTDTTDFVKEVILAVAKQMEFDIEENKLKEEIDKTMNVLDNPLVFATKFNLQ
ncbi:MAG: hypothetical protein QXO84_03265 [Candidatus Aenigmatarchaeota archaeon]